MINLDEEQTKRFEELVKPIIEFLNDSDVFHPHVAIIITNTYAEIVEGIKSFHTTEFLRD